MGKFSMIKEIEAVRIISPENASTTDVDKHLKKESWMLRVWETIPISIHVGACLVSSFSSLCYSVC